MRHSLQRRLGLVGLAAGLTVMAATTVHGQATGSVQATGAPLLVNKLRESQSIVRPEATAYMIWTTGTGNNHEVWYRIAGGDALFRQRLRVFKENAPPRAENTLPPASRMVHEISSNQATSWYVMGPEQGSFTYYIDGDHRRNDGSWENDRGVTVKEITYSNGTLYQIGFEYRVILDDYNDLIIEVAVIRP